MAIPEHIKRLRQFVGTDLLLVPSVTAFARHSNGTILVVRPRQGARWTLPGGLVELGENPADAIRRETLEESGIDIMPISVLGVFGGPDGFRRTYSNGDQIECLEILFNCRIVGETCGQTDDEIAETAFHTPLSLRDWGYPVSVHSLCKAEEEHRVLLSSPRSSSID